MALRTTPPPNISLKTTAQRRARIKPDLKSKLEEEYKKNPRPNKDQKHSIAQAFDMSDDNVHFWFQNRRARASRESKKRKPSADRGHSETASSQQEPNLDTSLTSSDTQQKNFTSAPTLTDLRPRLPSIGVLFDSQSAPNPASSPMLGYPPTSSSYIMPYFHHPPFGIENSYLVWKHSRFPPSSQ